MGPTLDCPDLSVTVTTADQSWHVTASTAPFVVTLPPHSRFKLSPHGSCSSKVEFGYTSSVVYRTPGTYKIRNEGGLYGDADMTAGATGRSTVLVDVIHTINADEYDERDAFSLYFEVTPK